MADDDVMKDLVREELGHISESGESASREDLRDRLGMGLGDLDRVLGELVTDGVAQEMEPGRFRLFREDDGEPAPAREASRPDEAGTDQPQPRGRMTAFQAGDHREEYAREATVTMPRAMVDALDGPALGSLLKAGLESSDASVAFVFAVTP